MKNKKILILLMFTLVVLSSQSAEAYINPGSGADFFQIIMSAFATIGAFIKTIFDKLTGKKKDEKDYE